MSAMPLEKQTYSDPIQAEEGAIDVIYLSRQTMGNDMLQREILALFLTQAQVCIQKLEEILERSRDEIEHDTAKNWQMLTHTLKGAARGVGAWETADAAEVAETNCPSADHSAAATALQKLTRSVKETCDFIDRYCGAS